MTEETTTEQLAEIDRDMAEIERQVAELVEEAQRADYKTQELPEYTPPGGWRVLAVGEVLREGDMWVWPTDDQLRQTVHIGAVVGANQRYIRPIEPDKPQPQPAEYTPPEGWRVVRFGESLQPGDMWVNQDGTEQRSNILQWDASAVSGGRCIRRIEPQAESQPQPEPEAATIEELRSEVSYVQNLLGTERRRVTQLEELVTSLRTINRGCENAVRDAGQENTALRNQLAAVKAELTSVAADRYRLQIELDAAQQVPADSPELRQLRADLAEVTRERDQYRHCYDEVSSHLETIEKTAKAAAVEAIVEWLQPIRTCGSQALATAVVSNLPHIMRSVTGLADEEIE